MRRRSFLWAAGAALCSFQRGSAQNPLGTLTWVEADGLWIRELPHGAPAKIASTAGLHTPRFSSTGAWITYLDADENRFVVSRDGRIASRFEAALGLLPPEDRLPPDAVLSPDGKRYAAVEMHENPPAADGWNEDRTELRVVPLAAPGERTRVLIPSNPGGIQIYGWTRDGKSILYWRADEWSGSLWSDDVSFYSMPGAGGPERKLGSALAHDDVLCLAPKTAGNRLAVTRSVNGRMTWEGQRVAIVDLDTGSERTLTSDDVAAICPSWSPGGRTIACTSGPDAGLAWQKSMAGHNIKVLNPDGTVGTQAVTPQTRIDVGGDYARGYLWQRKIWLLDPAGAAAPRRLTDDPHYRDEEPMWSADGNHILFGRMDSNSQTSLWLMGADGSGAAQVCHVKLRSDFPRQQDSWFGYYGYLDWRSAFDWRHG
jgi:dipeptidyl aminopeptidase/acylaminoacyl peptidase